MMVKLKFFVKEFRSFDKMNSPKPPWLALAQGDRA